MAKWKATAKKNVQKRQMRKFGTGAIRDANHDKLSFIKALSPLVLKRYVEYIGKHRLCPDGSVRDWDNWKQGIPEEVYMDSKGRHFIDAWLHYEGYSHEAVYDDIEDVLCAELFNTMGFLHEILKKKLNKKSRRKR